MRNNEYIVSCDINLSVVSQFLDKPNFSYFSKMKSETQNYAILLEHGSKKN